MRCSLEGCLKKGNDYRMRKGLHFLLLAFLLFHAWHLLVHNSSTSLKADFAVYCEASARLYEGADIYSHIYDDDIYGRVFEGTRGDGKHFRMHYFYPPFLALAFRPFAAMKFEEAKKLWSAINYILYILAAFWGALLLRPVLKKRAGFVGLLNAVLLLFAAYDPFYLSFYEGQINLLILVLLLGYVHWCDAGRDSLAGCALALAVAIKMSPAILVIDVMWNRRWKVLGAMVITGAALLGILFASPIEGAAYSKFFLKLSDLSAGRLEISHFFNVAFMKMTLMPLGLDSSETARRIVVTIFMLGSLALLPFFRRGIPFCRTALQGVLISVMVLVSPTTWFHHFVWGVIPLLICAKGILTQDELDYRRLTLVTGAYLILAKGYGLHAMAVTSESPLLFLTGALPNLALLMCIFLLVSFSRSSELPPLQALDEAELVTINGS